MYHSILFDGDLGSGKTLSAVALATHWSSASGVPLLSNMTIKGSRKIEEKEDWALIAQCRDKGSILLLDEAQSLLDSRTSQTKGQVKFTEALAYLRKMRCLVIFTTPSLDLVDVRVRQRLSLRIYVSKVKDRIMWDIFDPYTGVFKCSKLIKQSTMSQFYGLYDTFELIPPIELPTDLNDFLARPLGGLAG
ncbi:zonular occludens toxin domain-containing protein [Desulfosporosinus sp. PR]|uniref:zonular occludens toxin domain-containing protein n=1 Tax=Candidatus Desulfosporosinus nitrosoreducens TaxID=3401928 RepID=UPI0027EDA684|nr:zonular occludens toxin domain-containing protein [Desulfosporosinus sp. PR]MDQ7094987.1 zonular occludens toxin domain-containing protein [Desulfosporosinus sp. PR]